MENFISPLNSFPSKDKIQFSRKILDVSKTLSSGQTFFLHKKLGPVFWTGCFYSYSIPSSGQVFHLPKDTYLILPSRQYFPPTLNPVIRKECFPLWATLFSGQNASPYEQACFQDRFLLTSHLVFGPKASHYEQPHLQGRRFLHCRTNPVLRMDEHVFHHEMLSTILCLGPRA